MSIKSIRLFSMGILISFLFASSWNPALAQTQTQQRFRLLLAYPDPKNLFVPAGMNLEESAKFAREIYNQQVHSLLNALEPEFMNGSLSDVQLLPESYSISVAVHQPHSFTLSERKTETQNSNHSPIRVLESSSNTSIEISSDPQFSSRFSDNPQSSTSQDLLSQLNGMNMIAGVETEDSTPSQCARSSADRFRDEIMAVSTWQQVLWLRQQSTASATNDFQPPSIHINLNSIPAYVEGNVGGSIPVHLTILRSGVMIGEDSTISNADGNYLFMPSSNSNGCHPGEPWTLQVGDVVQISANNITAQTVVVNLKGYAYAEGQVVEGSAPVGRSVVALLSWHESQNLCETATAQSATVPVNANGTYRAPVSTRFNRSASGFVEALDIHGNGTYQRMDHYSLIGNRWGGYDVILRPKTSFTIQQRRNGVLLAMHTGVTDATGHYHNYFDGQPGDELSLTAGTIAMKQVIIIEPVITIDDENNTINGTTTPGVAIHLGGTKSFLEPYHCQENENICLTQVADSNGNFSFQLTEPVHDLNFGVSFMTIEGEGWNMYYSAATTLKLLTSADEGRIEGRWYEGTKPLTVRLLDEGGIEQKAVTVQRPEPTNSFFVQIGMKIPYGWQVGVSDGEHSVTMTIALDRLAFDPENDQINGSALSGHLKAHSGFLCQETDIETDGPFTFSGAEIPANFYLYVTHTAANGFQTRRYLSVHSYPLSFLYYPGEWRVDGQFDAPYGVVSAYLIRGTTQLATGSVENSNSGFFTIGLRPSNYLYQTGDSIRLQKPDGSSFSVELPYGSVNLDPVNQRVFGQAPADTIVQAGVLRDSPGGAFKYLSPTSVDADGIYDFTIKPGAIWQMYNCNLVDVTQRCVYPYMTYSTPKNYEFGYFGQPPLPEAADDFESDDTVAEAVIYSQPQRHTLHTADDIDWIQFEVSQSDVDNHNIYHIYTDDLGWDMATFVGLRDKSGTILYYGTYAINLDNNGTGVDIRVLFTQAGIYTLDIHGMIPVGDQFETYGGFCDSVYTVGIALEKKIYLPVIQR